jgi:hypothetical protein
MGIASATHIGYFQAVRTCMTTSQRLLNSYSNSLVGNDLRTKWITHRRVRIPPLSSTLYPPLMQIFFLSPTSCPTQFEDIIKATAGCNCTQKETSRLLPLTSTTSPLRFSLSHPHHIFCAFSHLPHDNPKTWLSQIWVQLLHHENAAPTNWAAANLLTFCGVFQIGSVRLVTTGLLLFSAEVATGTRLSNTSSAETSLELETWFSFWSYQIRDDN